MSYNRGLMRCCRFTLRQALVGCHQQAAALAAVHEEGIVHNDFRLANVLFSLAGHAWLLSDFGSAAERTCHGQPNILHEIL